MLYQVSWFTVRSVIFIVALALGFALRAFKQSRSAEGFFANNRRTHWLTNGVALAGAYLSAFAFPAWCGMIAFYGGDGVLLAIVCLAGWALVPLFAGPINRRGQFTLGDALGGDANSRAVKISVGLSTLMVSLLYLVPQFAIAGRVLAPLLGLQAQQCVLAIGLTATLIPVLSGMAGATWAQVIKGSLLLSLFAVLTGLVLHRGFSTTPDPPGGKYHPFAVVSQDGLLKKYKLVPETGPWIGQPFVRIEDHNGFRAILHKDGAGQLSETQSISNPQILSDGEIKTMVNSVFQGTDRDKGELDLYPVGSVLELPDGKTQTGPLGPVEFLNTFEHSNILLWSWGGVPIKENSHLTTTIYYRREISGHDVRSPGQYFTALVDGTPMGKLDVASLLLALFFGAISLPHIVIRHCAVNGSAAARKSAIVGGACVGLFFLLAMYVGIGAMTSGNMDLTDTSMAILRLGQTFGDSWFGALAGLVFLAAVGTGAGLMVAVSGAVAHDLSAKQDERFKVKLGRITAAGAGIAATVLAMRMPSSDPMIWIGWTMAIAAAAHVPAMVLRFCWKRVTSQGIAASVIFGLLGSLVLILLSPACYKNFYGLPPEQAPLPISHPALLILPLGFAVVVVVSLFTQATGNQAGKYHIEFGRLEQR